MVNNAGASYSQVGPKGEDRRAAVGLSWPLCLSLLLLFFSTLDKSDWASEEADQALAFLDLLLDFVTGCGDLSLRGEDCTDEGEHGATHGSVEGPAHGAQPGPVWSCIGSTVQLYLV